MNNNQYKNKLAKLNPYNSIADIFEINEEKYQLIGVKNVAQVSNNLVKMFEETGLYKLHTLDKYALGGRAIDLSLINPITGRYMTGSSSGTAINVFTYINDLGIGIDGGGSVLAPAMSLNLFSFVCPLIDSAHLDGFSKVSTDNIKFRPSVGFMTRELTQLKNAACTVLQFDNIIENPEVLISNDDQYTYDFLTNKIQFCDTLGSRDTLIKFLNTYLNKCDVIISIEGPIDTAGFGDTIYGHFDSVTQNNQRLANKGLIRVCNMASATALSVPCKELGVSFVLICESNLNKIATLFDLASKIDSYDDELISRYYSNLKMYFPDKYEVN